jgi:hypothetical protein
MPSISARPPTPSSGLVQVTALFEDSFGIFRL